MRLFWRALAVLLTFLLAGFWTAHAVILHAVAQGTPEYKVRMAGAMAGLFAGGLAACLVALALFLGRSRHTRADQSGD